MEIWAAVDILGGNVVRLVSGSTAQKIVYGSDPLEFAERWERENADGLHVVDLDAALGSGSNQQIIRTIIKEARIPVQVGGGIRSEDLASEYLKLGAKRLAVGSVIESYDTTGRFLQAFGPDRLIFALDHAQGVIRTRGWTWKTQQTLYQAMSSLHDLGAKNFLVTAIARDGTMLGPEVDFMKKASALNVAIYVSGGIATTRDVESCRASGAKGVVIGRALYERKLSLAEAKDKARE